MDKIGEPVHAPEELSSDELVIDLSIEDKRNKNKTRKRKRNDQINSSEDDSITQIDGAEEIEDNLSSAAAKNNLTSANVKNILKRVVLNEHVLAIVKLREEEIENLDKNLEPKLTRAKTKKLKSAISSVSWPLPITPVKVPNSVSPEVTSLISQDLPDEESDEEYDPNLEDHSEDDKDTLESSDIDSLPQTPATPDVPIQNEKFDSEIKYSEDGIFKIPHDIETGSINGESEATIALRTRSKLSLNDIPIEKIEESFFPPDITKDMYEFEDCHIDGTWRDFLQEFSKPLSNNNEDDDDGDPEYNAAAETEIFDFEELREDADVEVSRKELKDLVEELFNDMEGIIGIPDLSTPNPQIMPNPVCAAQSDLIENDNTSPMKILDISKSEPFYSDNSVYGMQNYTMVDEQNKKENAPNNSINETSFENNMKENSICMEGSSKNKKLGILEKLKLKDKDFNICEDVMDWYFSDGEINILPEQRLLLDQQMRKHVQLAAQCFLQTHAHPKLWKYGPKEKEFLLTLKYLGENKPNSAFMPCNLIPALEVCELWEKKLADNSEESKKIFQHIVVDSERTERRKTHGGMYYGTFHDYFYEVVLNSKAFVYPYLLPSFPFRPFQSKSLIYLLPEDQLIAMGLEQFCIYLKANGETASTRKDPLGITKMTELVCKYMMPPFRPLQYVSHHIKYIRRMKEPNPIKHFFTTGQAPPTVDSLESFDPDKFPKDYPLNSFPYSWQKKILSKTKRKKWFDLSHDPPVDNFLPNNWSNHKTTNDVADVINFENQTDISKDGDRGVDNCDENVHVALDEDAINSDQDSPCDVIQSDDNLSSLKTVVHIASTPKQKSHTINAKLDSSNPKNKPNSPDELVKRDSPVKLLRRLSHLLFLCNESCGRILSHFELNVKSTFVSLEEISRKLKVEISNILTMLPSMPFISNVKEQKDSDVSNEVNELPQLDSGNDNVECTTQKSTSKKAIDEKHTPALKPCVSQNPGKQRQATKAQKELEVNRAMFLTKDPYADDLKETLYAASYLEKVKTRLMQKTDNSDTAISFENFQSIINSFNPALETPSELYLKIDSFLGQEYSDLTEEFLTFLTPGQADEVGKFMDHFMLTCMSEFLERVQIYFANKPAQLKKILWSLEKLTEKSESELTIDSIKNTIIPLLKGNQYLIDWFLQLFPDEKPPDSLINSGYEVIDCDKISKDNGEDLFPGIGLDYETLEIPPVEENYGNESCICSCHESSNEKYKNRTRHCLACGMKYIQGRVYIQHGRTLRAVHLNWHESSNRHIDQARRLSVPFPTRQIISRRKATSLEPSNQNGTKNDSDEERISPKRSGKCLRTPTSKTKNAKMHCSRSICKSMEAPDQICIKPSCSKDLIKDAEIGIKILTEKTESQLVENESNNEDDLFEMEDMPIIKRELPIQVIESNTNEFEMTDDSEQVQKSSDSKEVILKSELIYQASDTVENPKTPENLSVIDDKQKCISEPSLLKSDDEIMWTRNEDKIILLILRSDMEYEDTLQKIKSLLPQRSLEEIGRRVQNVMNLLKKIASDP